MKCYNYYDYEECLSEYAHGDPQFIAHHQEDCVKVLAHHFEIPRTKALNAVMLIRLNWEVADLILDTDYAPPGTKWLKVESMFKSIVDRLTTEGIN